ncbi:MAG TPA: UDP-4-amino-4,6-dideoxy-N-acetyl-beta-L-altrosamine transaminase [Candidatus Nanoarchaeia archaeon]|nr:UDP-4-amino-4,6-dideoxy-N-acetyl-beta-L-altrosamine transaminase [Candidatus Nanoarchaeia archaeon]
MKFIPYGKPCIDEDDIRTVVEVLRSDWLTTGPKVAEFEQAFTQYIGCRYAIAVSSGTAALELAVASLELGNGEVITTPMTFVATANSLLYNNLTPVFVDIDDTLNINPKELEAKITSKTKAIMTVDFAGQPCNYTEIKNIAKKHNLKVIEDAAHALGASWNETKVGNIADITAFSFHPVKNITTGEGGMITTNNREYYDKCLMLRHHGIDKNDKTFGGDWAFNMKVLGRNYRLTDFQCALGISQLKKLDRYNKRRAEIAQRYTEELKKINEIKLPMINNKSHAWHLFVILCNKIDRNRLFDKLKQKSIGANVHYIPVYKHEFYKHMKVNCPGTEWVGNKILTLPLYPTMTNEEVQYVIDAVKSSIVEEP